MSGRATGRSRLMGNGKQLLGHTKHTVCIADHIDHRFNLENFLEATCWLNDQVGETNWCYDGMTYHFREKEDLVNFKLRYLCDG